MNPLILKLCDILKSKFPKDMTSINVHIFNHVDGSREIEFWVHTEEAKVFLDPKDMHDYVVGLEGKKLMYSDFEKTWKA